MEKKVVKQLVLFEEKDKLEVPAREIVYKLYYAGWWSEVKEIVSDRQIEFQLPLQMRKGHAFWNFEFQRKGVLDVPDGFELLLKEEIDHTDLGNYRQLYTYRAVLIDIETLLNISGTKIRYVLYEQGGGMSNTGHALVYCNSEGEALKPLYIIRRGHLALGKHAAFGLWEHQTMIEIHASHHRRSFYLALNKVTATKQELVTEKLWGISEVDRDNWKEALPNMYTQYTRAIEAAIDKALCYHCREPHYLKAN